MKAKDFFGGEDQDSAVELRLAILKFRDEVYEKAEKAGPESRRLATCLIQSLFGMSFNYKPCCIFDFVANTYRGVIPPKSISEVDGRNMCPKCQADGLDITE